MWSIATTRQKSWFHYIIEEVLLEKPKLIHFTGGNNPWKYESSHPHRKAYFEVLNKCPWKSWKPEKPNWFVFGQITSVCINILKMIYRQLRRVSWSDSFDLAQICLVCFELRIAYLTLWRKSIGRITDMWHIEKRRVWSLESIFCCWDSGLGNVRKIV